MERLIKNKRKFMGLVLAIVLLVSVMLTSCSGTEQISAAANYSGTVTETTDKVNQDIESVIDMEYNEADVKTGTETGETEKIVLNGNSIVYSGSKATVSGTVITIIQSGTYSLSGSLEDGQIIVNTIDDGTVYLILNGVEIHSSDSAPIYVIDSEKTIINLAEDTNNILSDGTDRVFADTEDEEPDSVIFSEDDLTINGSGSLIVNAEYKHGIVCKDDLKIIDGNITVDAVSDGIRGRDSVIIYDGTITIKAESDGIQSNNDTEEGKGFVAVQGGTVNILCENDGIQAATDLVVDGGIINITAGGGTQNIVVDEEVSEQQKDMMATVEETESTKGLKAGSSMMISAGNITIDSHDDAIHSDGTIGISGGTFNLSTDDDAIHADTKIIIDNGTIDIINSYEGIESKVVIINDGEFDIRASDDGINVADGTASAMRPGFEIATDGVELHINGGYIYITSNADSIDSNGNVYMTGGILIANGPESPTNGALDSDGLFEVDGGLIVAAGSSGMAVAPGESSGQNSILYTFDTEQSADTIIYIEDDDGKQILAFEPTKDYQSLVFSSPELEEGVTYTIYTGGSMDSEASDGVYESGQYSEGYAAGSFELSGVLTVIGTQSGRGGFAPTQGGMQNPGGLQTPDAGQNPGGGQTPGRRP